MYFSFLFPLRWFRRRAGPYLIAFLFAINLFAGMGQAFALTGPEKYVGEVGNRAVVIARNGGTNRQLTAHFRDMLHQYSSIKAVAPQFLGPYRGTLPGAKKREYQHLVEDYTARLFAGYSKRFAGQKMQVTGSRKRGSRHTVVTTQVLYGSNVTSSPIKWMVMGRQNGYTIVDINVYGVWLSIHLRSEFKKVLHRSHGNFGALFLYLKK